MTAQYKFISAPLFTSNSPVSLLPLTDAKASGVKPSLSLSFTSEPLAISKEAISLLFLYDAICKAVSPSLVYSLYRHTFLAKISFIMMHAYFAVIWCSTILSLLFILAPLR
jgi:hypothetical protein